MALDPKVFKAYDVRGIYPSELDEEGAYAIGRAYAEHFEPKGIAVGRDMRLSSPVMAEAVVRGASEGGADVVDIGIVGTEMVYFAVGELGLDGGIAVTASHNPKEYTGMKIVRRGALPVGGESGLLEIRDRALALLGHDRGQTPDVSRKVDIYPAFVEKVLSFVDVSAVRPLRIVFDAANGMAGAMLPPLLERLPVDAVRCFFEPDGSFPNHEPNPLLEENREFIVAKVREEGADVGHAFIKHRMREVDAAFAGEVSGHYYFREFSQADSGTIPALLLLELISKKGKPLSEILAPYRERYFITGEINSRVDDVPLKLQELKEHFAEQGEISHLDGISVTADDWHLNVRPSNTEPLLRLNLEALDRGLMERKRDEALAVINS